MTHPHDRQKKLAATERRAQIAQLMVSGVRHQYTLAGMFGVNQSTISNDIKIIEAEWLRQTVNDVAAAKSVDLLRIDRMIVAAWPAATKGDPRAIAEVRNLIKLRADILGYAAPTKIEANVNMHVLAEQVAAELGLSVGDVIAEAERIIAGAA